MQNFLDVITANVLNTFIVPFQNHSRIDISTQNWYNGENMKTNWRSSQARVPDVELDNIRFHSPVKDPQPYVTSPFGWRVCCGSRNFHTGTDLRSPAESPGFAIEDAKILSVTDLGKRHNRFAWKNGQWVLTYSREEAPTPGIIMQGIHTGNQYWLLHFQRDMNIHTGSMVTAGQPLGHFGNYGYSIGSHCHVEVHVFRRSKNIHERVNPRLWFKKRAGIEFTGRIRAVTVQEYNQLQVGA